MSGATHGAAPLVAVARPSATVAVPPVNGGTRPDADAPGTFAGVLQRNGTAGAEASRHGAAIDVEEGVVDSRPAGDRFASDTVTAPAASPATGPDGAILVAATTDGTAPDVLVRPASGGKLDVADAVEPLSVGPLDPRPVPASEGRPVARGGGAVAGGERPPAPPADRSTPAPATASSAAEAVAARSEAAPLPTGANGDTAAAGRDGRDLVVDAPSAGAIASPTAPEGAAASTATAPGAETAGTFPRGALADRHRAEDGPDVHLGRPSPDTGVPPAAHRIVVRDAATAAASRPVPAAVSLPADHSRAVAAPRDPTQVQAIVEDDEAATTVPTAVASREAHLAAAARAVATSRSASRAGAFEPSVGGAPVPDAVRGGNAGVEPFVLVPVGGAPPMSRTESVSASPMPIVPHSVPLNDTGGAAEGLAAGVRWTAAEGRGQAWINVTPAGLGPVAIHVALENDGVSVSIAASQAGAREALEPLIPRLREQLVADGHQSVDVDLSGGREEARTAGEGRDGRAGTNADGRADTSRARAGVARDATVTSGDGIPASGDRSTPLVGGQALVDSWA